MLSWFSSHKAVPALRIAAEIVLILAMGAGSMRSTQAQFFDFGFFGQRPSSRQWAPWTWHRPQQRPQQPVDSSRAPAPRKQEATPTEKIVVMGDSMADWLAYGLEEAFAESPEIGVVRKDRSSGGLIRSEGRQAYDWPQAAREIVAAEKPAYVVIMMGVNDRQSIRERPPKAPTKPPAGAQNPENAGAPQTASKEPAQPEAPADSKQAATAEPASHAVTYEFHTENWEEAYGRRIDEMIAAVKSKNVTVLWVGLPPVRGTRSSSDIAYLNELYRGYAEKSGITYVDIWDGFVDESGNFAPHGPDFEGQIRRLRSGDGVHFTKAGARKLAHYVEREIRHAMTTHNAPMTIPTSEESQPAAQPGTPTTRPAAGPVIPLGPPSPASEGLLGGAAARSPEGNGEASRVLVKGEPVPGLAGRADDFSWPKPASPAVAPEPEPASKPATAAQQKPAAPKRHAPRAGPPAGPAARAAPGEGAPRPLSLSNNTSPEPRRARPREENGLRPPAMVPFSPFR